MKTILHYKTRYLNLSETFIDRVVRSHKEFRPVVATVQPLRYTDGLPLEVPRGRISFMRNWATCKLNRCPGVVYRALRKYRPAVLHAHFGIDGYRLHRAAAAHALPLVVSFYGSDVVRLYDERGWPRRYGKLARANVLFTAPTAYMKRDLIDRGFPEERIAVVPFGIDLSDMTYRPRTSAHHAIMMVGRLVEKKGFEFGLRAFKRMCALQSGYTLDIYGDGPLRPALSALAQELGIAHAVKFHGSVPNAVVRDALYMHDALLVPSVTASDGDTEGLPNTILEGMACGTPVLATRHVGIPEAVVDQRTGWLSEERDDVGLGHNLLDALANPEKRLKLAESARKLVETEYRIEAVVQRIERVYDTAIAASRASTRTETSASAIQSVDGDPLVRSP